MSWIRKWVRKKLGGEGGNPGTSIWIHTAILWLESRYKQCCCCCKVKVWITVLHSVWQNKRGEYQRGDHCTICYLKGPLHLFYTWTYHSLCLWGNLTCINYICKKKKKKGYPVIVLVNKQISAVTVENMQYNKITVLFLFSLFVFTFLNHTAYPSHLLISVWLDACLHALRQNYCETQR